MKQIRIVFLWMLVSGAVSSYAQSFRLPEKSIQLITGVSADWQDSTVLLQRWQKEGGVWEKIGQPMSARLGTNGSAWGRGLHPPDLPGLQKKEGDKKAPAGIFLMGDVYGYDASITRQPGMRVHQVTEQDLWVEDVTSDFYNQHIRLPNRGPETEWEKKQQMRLNDPAHRLKWFIQHNVGAQIKKGAGSSIFFHIWRDSGARSSYGCTVMAEKDLRELIAWADPAKQPLYVLLPRSVYEEKKAAWGLP
jgi:L,D-peptidoglycan transpeptidase YkuD (ErfK/YbiS/YcfS/YnhG family)